MSNSPRRVVVIDKNRARAAIIEEGLRDAGISSVVVIDDLTELIRRLVEIDPDVIFADLESPNRDQLEFMLQVPRAIKRPVAMFVDQSDHTATEAAIDAGVSAYIVDGLRKERVKSILDMAVSRFNAFHRLERELEAARSALAERKVIDQAKFILMKAHGLMEQDAYALLRRTAMNQGRRIAAVAESVVVAAGLLRKDIEQ